MAYTPPEADRLRPESRAYYIGRFYEDLANHLLRGERNTNDYDSQGDIFLYNMSAIVEVKGTNNRDSTTILLTQLAKLRENLSFPFTYCYYLLFGYQNHSTKKKQCRGRRRDYPYQRLLTNKSLTQEKLTTFLKAQTDIALLIDSEILERIAAVKEDLQSAGRRHNYRYPAIQIGRRYINALATNGELAKLSFPAKKFAVRTFRLEPSPPYESMGFRVVAILPPRQLKLIERVLAEHCTITESPLS